ncbi:MULTISPECIES: HIT family protein [Streptococcus]|jgi:histidine triad (HIT) family protein|uniref:HIT family protein n=1 Tax=Streptococcus viridans TaxID=78535 RepID=A0A447Z2X0_9STRE|nr:MULTISPECIES: HIT family protein [Streptococcus]MDB8650590.1 HIT family protein [Streptococcus australis]RXV51110.1 HIT family protein [Streptococcus australis]VED66675.1 HIT family protein [Streptococcus viridans]VEE18469.1 HIT family protein [Streptococcus australis]
MVSDCIFCKIVAGEIPASKVYEDDHFLAFLDISQVTPGHTLVIPKKHARNLLEMTPDETAALFNIVSRVTKKVESATQPQGMNIISNMEEIAGQSVFHTHVHILPRYSQEDDLKIDFIAHEPDFDRLAQLAKDISNH